MSELWDVLDKNRNKTGRLHERGKKMQKDEYHLIVHVWVVNDKNEFLISKRTPNKSYPNMWECTGGSVIAGDDSLTTAIKEVGEELGVILEPQNGFLLKQYHRCCEVCGGGGDFVDVWVFRQNIDISSVALQPDETCDAMWATKEKIELMIEEKAFIGRELYFYIDELVKDSIK